MTDIKLDPVPANEFLGDHKELETSPLYSDDAHSSRSGKERNGEPPRYTFFEILVGFIAAVSAWGVLDCLVELAAYGSKLRMAVYYAACFATALLIQVIGKFFKRRFDIAHALEVFA